MMSSLLKQVREAGHRRRAMRELLPKAIDVFGSRARALEWMTARALALDGQRPIELLGTPEGAEDVRLLLIRLEYSVYT